MPQEFDVRFPWIYTIEIIADEDAAELVLEVRRLILDGWQPLGGVFMSTITGAKGKPVPAWCMTMVRYE